MTDHNVSPPVSTPGYPIIYVTRNAVSVTNGSTFNIGSFQQNSSQTFVFMIQNNGGINLDFAQGGISSSGQTSIPSSPTNGQSYSISPSAGVLVTVQINTATPGVYTNQAITLVSNAFIDSVFTINLSFDVTAVASPPPPPPPTTSGSTSPPPPPPPPPSSLPTLVLSRVDGSVIANNVTTSLPAVGLNISKSLIIQFANTGSSSLNITNISISGDVTFDSAIQNGFTVNPNSTRSITLSLSTSSLGNKRITIIVSSNDTANNPYRISLTYVVAPQSNLAITDSGNSAISDGTVFALGLVNKGTTPTKTYTLRNNGIYKNVTVNSISVTGNVVLQSSPNLPATLEPSSANAITFVISFPSSNVGQKSGTVVIDWS